MTVPGIPPGGEDPQFANIQKSDESIVYPSVNSEINKLDKAYLAYMENPTPANLDNLDSALQTAGLLVQMNPSAALNKALERVSGALQASRELPGIGKEIDNVKAELAGETNPKAHKLLQKELEKLESRYEALYKQAHDVK